MGFMDVLKSVYENTNNRINATREQAQRMETYELVRKWRNCSDPIKKGVYYQEMQNRDDINEYL